MAEFSLKEHLARAGAFVGLIRKHQDDLTDLADDVPKAIAIAQDFHDLLKAEEAKASAQAAPPEPQAKPQAAPAPKPAAAPAPPRVTAAHAAQHIKERGLSEAERAAFDRASRNIG